MNLRTRKKKRKEIVNTRRKKHFQYFLNCFSSIFFFSISRSSTPFPYSLVGGKKNKKKVEKDRLVGKNKRRRKEK